MVSRVVTDSFDSSAAPKQEGYVEQENMETKKGEIRKRRQKRMPGEIPYRPYRASGIAPCEICGQIFGPSDMVKHMVTHTGARDYKCDICSESFPQQSILNRFEDMLIVYRLMILITFISRHKKIHEEPCPYHCSYCKAVGYT